jgi:hypothetical protein
MNPTWFISVCALIAAPAQSAQTKATKESAVAALQNWEVCSNELYTLVTSIQLKRKLLPVGADAPEELKAQMSAALAKKNECKKLLALANAEGLRYTEEK